MPSLVEIGPVVLEKKYFINFVNIFSLFHTCLPYEKGAALHLNKLECSSPKDTLYQVWLKLAKWLLRRIFFNFVHVFSLFRFYLTLEGDGALYLNKLESPSPNNSLCQVWLKLAQWFWIRK